MLSLLVALPHGVLAMSRAKFDSLPAAARETIRKHSGARLLEQSQPCLEAKGREMAKVLNSDPRRQVVIPSAADQAEADKIFVIVTEEWAAQNPRHRELLTLLKAEIAKARAER